MRIERKDRTGKRQSIVLHVRASIFCVLALLSGPGLRAQNIPFSKLSDCQRTRFNSFQTGSTPPGAQMWLSLDDSRRVEYAGGTQALNATKILPPCQGLNEPTAVTAIWGSRANLPSADQFHIEVKWLSKADDAFEKVNGWGPHISWLHPGQYGFQENRNGNPFLGIVVLFDENDHQTGQFHIDFRSWFAHYFPNNGNVAKNYKRYCSWYGRIDGYSQPCPGQQPEFDWRAVATTAVTNTAAQSPNSDLRETVREFLNEWYVRQNLDGLSRYLAEDNAARSMAELGFLPGGAVRSYWDSLFAEAFENGPGAEHFLELSNAIQYREPSLPVSAASLRYLNDNPEQDHFAILAPNSIADVALLPPTPGQGEQMDPSAQFLKHLKETYRAEDPKQNRLLIVVYLATGAGLLKETAVSYWIKEGTAWKIAAFQGTD